MKRRFIVIFFSAALIFGALSSNSNFDLNSYMAFFKEKTLSFNHLDETKLVMPQTLTEPDDREFYNDHFQSIDGHFILVADDDCVAYTGPDNESEIFETLDKSLRVRVLYKKSQLSSVDGENRQWVFVSTENGETLLGWVLNDQLVYPVQFKAMPNSIYKELYYQKGDLTASMMLRQNAWFQVQWTADGGGLFLSGNDKGRLYIYNDIVWAKKVNQDFLYEFFMRDGDELRHERMYRQQPITRKLYTLESK